MHSSDVTNHQEELLQAALSYAKQGLKVFPLHTPTNGGCSCEKGKGCNASGKHPQFGNWANNASSDVALVRDIWTIVYPDANVGIHCEGLLVLDIDSQEGQSLIEGYGDLSHTPTVLTHKGKHYYFQLPQGVTFKNAVRFLPGCDIRTTGGYVVAPPSIHSSGDQYKWLNTLDDCPLAFSCLAN